MATPAHPTPAERRRVSLIVKAPLQDREGEEPLPTASLYAFSTGGALLAQAPLGADGEARLELTLAEFATGLRVLAGPTVDDKAPSIDNLLRLGAHERHLRVEANARSIELEWAVTRDIWRHWLPRRCLVQGRLQKRLVRDGVTVDLPVCQATVEIYEVDPFYVLVDRLPRAVTERLRNLIAQPPRLQPAASRNGPRAELRAEVRAEFRVEGVPELDDAAQAALSDAVASTPLRLAAASGSESAFRQSLVNHAHLLRPLICFLHPTFVTMQRVGTAVTDDCGHFRTRIFKSFFNPDQPDLYFRATQRLFGFFTVPIYAPTPVACHTWWNYVCGTSVNLISHHPLAITCSPCPPIMAGANWVLFMAIGNHPLSRIRGTGQALGVPSAAARGLTEGDAPWGGTLRPRLEFDNSLRENLGVRYYRFSWKRDGEPDSSYQPVSGTVNRHYAHVVGGDLVLDAYNLGPRAVGAQANLFEIPPAIPPLGQWSLPDVVENTSSGIFNTQAVDGPGETVMSILDSKIALRLELFDAAGAPVDTTALGIQYVVPTSLDLSGTIHTVPAASLGLVQGSSMVIGLHVNNEACTAAIAAPTIGGAEADACCGVLKYGAGSSVTLGWTASHPHGFATYGFGVVRGATGVYSASGAVGAGVFSQTSSVNDLLTVNLAPECVAAGCPVAGYSENLHVYASATDGWSRQSQYDDGAVRAFVLAPV